MAKILIPLLVLTGVALGLYLLLRGRRVTVPSGATGLRLVILAAAASVVGGVGADSVEAKGKPKKPPEVMPTCYEPMPPPPPPVPESAAKAIERIEKRIDKLEKLHSKGKLDEQAYLDALAKMKKDMEILDRNEESCFQDIGQIESDIASIRKDMDAKLMPQIEKQKAWKTLKKQYAQLHERISGKQNTYSGDAVEKALEKLEKKDLITPQTSKALGLVFREVDYHYERSHAGKTCYDMTMLGVSLQTWRHALTELLTKLKGTTPSDAGFVSTLHHLAAAVECFDIQNETACDTSSRSDLHTRVSLTQALDLIVALGK